MSDSNTSSQAKQLPEEDTKAGSYFVSNYPPFSHWSPEENSSVKEILTSTTGEDTPLGLYYHIPFCRKRCHFCYFRIYTDKNSSEINQYLDATIRELEIYASSPYIKDRPLKFVYFGGGTPSYLTKSQLHSLGDRMQKLLPWDQAEEIAFEGEPGTLNKGKLTAIKDMGVTRLSLGIESMDDHILEINGRAHKSREVYMAYENARELGFKQINVDLIAGMLEETEDNWKRTVEKTLELEPDNLTIYQMEIPLNTTIYRQMREEGKLVAPVASWPQKRAWVDYAFKQFEAAGYTVTSAYTAVKNPDTTKFVYRDKLWTGADMLAVGVSSFGHLKGLHYQNQAHFDLYLDSISKDSLPVFRSLMTNDDERMIRELILQMKTGCLSFSYFKNKFNTDIPTRFSKALDLMKNDHAITIEDDHILLTREGLLKVDTYLHHFFLPKHL